MELEIDCSGEAAQFLQARLASTDLLAVALKAEAPVRARKLLLIADFHHIPVEAMIKIKLHLKTRK